MLPNLIGNAKTMPTTIGLKRLQWRRNMENSQWGHEPEKYNKLTFNVEGVKIEDGLLLLK